MTVRGGGIPRRPLALTPNGRMGPPLRSFAADAHDCIMVRVLGPTGYKVVARLNRAPKAGSPLIVIATALSVPSCSKPSRYGLARAKHAARLVRRPILTASARIDLGDARVGMKKRTLRSNQETDEGKRCAALANSLTKKAPYKGHRGHTRPPKVAASVASSIPCLRRRLPRALARASRPLPSMAPRYRGGRTRFGGAPRSLEPRIGWRQHRAWSRQPG